jgi:hypothetical protein
MNAVLYHQRFCEMRSEQCEDVGRDGSEQSRYRTTRSVG